MAEAAKPVLFICYSHTDQKYRERFTKFLDSPALQNMTIFHDAKIQPGEDWLQRILGSLQKATAALVLVSQDFMISPFIQQVELREILTNHVRRGLRLFLVPVRSTLYQDTYLERLEWARPPDKPLALLSEAEQENAMVEICLKIGTKETKADAPTIESTIECLESMPKLDLPSAYELRELVGEGEFARCYRAHDPLLERDVIIKVLHTPLSRDSPGYDKYVRSTSRLNHRNILGLHFSHPEPRVRSTGAGSFEGDRGRILRPLSVRKNHRGRYDPIGRSVRGPGSGDDLFERGAARSGAFRSDGRDRVGRCAAPRHPGAHAASGLQRGNERRSPSCSRGLRGIRMERTIRRRGARTQEPESRTRGSSREEKQKNR